jgi:hypothetical protein
MIESLVHGPSAPDSLALLAAPPPAHTSAPVTININPQIIYAIESLITREFLGQANFGPQANELLDLINRFGGREEATLKTALDELEDPAAPPTARSKAKDRLKNFLCQLPSTAKDIGIDILEKYIERKMGLGG